jgi:hypothetical protein
VGQDPDSWGMLVRLPAAIDFSPFQNANLSFWDSFTVREMNLKKIEVFSLPLPNVQIEQPQCFIL